MKRSTLIPALILCAVAGWFSPLLWTGSPPPPARRILPRPAPTGIQAALQGRVRNAGSAMAQFQAVVAGVTGHGASLLAKPGAFSSFPCREAAELAAKLAGADFAQHAGDGTDFFESVRKMGWHARDAALAERAGQDPGGTLRFLVTLPPGDNPGDETERLIHHLTERDPEQTLQVLRAAGPVASQDAWNDLLGVLAKKDASLALHALEANPVPRPEKGVNAIVSELAKQDPEKALKWAQELKPELRRLVFTGPLFGAWAQKDRAGALAAWKAWDESTTGDPFAPHDFPDTIFAEWSRTDPAAAIAAWKANSSQTMHSPEFDPPHMALLFAEQ